MWTCLSITQNSHIAARAWWLQSVYIATAVLTGRSRLNGCVGVVHDLGWCRVEHCIRFNLAGAVAEIAGVLDTMSRIKPFAQLAWIGDGWEMALLARFEGFLDVLGNIPCGAASGDCVLPDS